MVSIAAVCAMRRAEICEMRCRQPGAGVAYQLGTLAPELMRRQEILIKVQRT